MKLNFLINNIKRDLRMIPIVDGNKVSLPDVVTVVERWSQALTDEATLTEAEQRFQDFLVKEPFERKDFKEAATLLMFIHRPLISGRNDVMGVRLRDADYLRLSNRVSQRPVEEGIAQFNQKVAQLEREERERKRIEKEKEEARKKKRLIEIDFESL